MELQHQYTALVRQSIVDVMSKVSHTKAKRTSGTKIDQVPRVAAGCKGSARPPLRGPLSLRPSGKKQAAKVKTAVPPFLLVFPANRSNDHNLLCRRPPWWKQCTNLTMQRIGLWGWQTPLWLTKNLLSTTCSHLLWHGPYGTGVFQPI